MTTAPADPQGMSDAELIASVRAGKLECYGTLYERHVAAAYNLARQLARTPMEADDLVSEAFSKVLDTLRGGKGPDSAFRAYLLTAVRHGAYDKTRKDKRVDLAEDMTAVGGAGAEALTVPFSDTAVAGLERTLAAKAFARLPERWQAVLWHTEIEQQSPAEVAPLLGLTPNGVSALAYRAREGLRQAYLQVHLAEVSASRCRATADRLGAWTRDGLSKRERAQVEQHLDECDDCQALAAELADVNGALRAVVAPLVLGGGVLGYLALSGAGKAGAATAVGAGAAAGSAGGAANAAASAPRQFVGVAASGVAMAAAVAVALTAGGGTPHIPVAVAPAPPAAQAPAVPGPAAPVPAPPAPQPAPPAPAPAPAPAPGPQPAPAPAPEPPAAPAPAPAPAPANVTAEAPADGVALEAGGSGRAADHGPQRRGHDLRPGHGDAEPARRRDRTRRRGWRWQRAHRRWRRPGRGGAAGRSVRADRLPGRLRNGHVRDERGPGPGRVRDAGLPAAGAAACAVGRDHRLDQLRKPGRGVAARARVGRTGTGGRHHPCARSALRAQRGGHRA
ncbi:sigma-70 family RNA polymerase sigma factor [Prauserella oleivorans]